MDWAFLNSRLLLAAQEGAPFGSWLSMATIWIPILLIFWFLLIRPQQREHSKRQQMINALKKNDRVIFGGGIYGVVTNVHREADEVTIKVDEATNAKLRVTMGSIVRVLGSDTPEQPSS